MPETLTSITSLVRERSRYLAPAVLLSLVFYVFAIGPFGIHPSQATYVATWILIAGLAVLTAAIVGRRIPDRRVHLASTAVLWFPMAATAISLYSTRNPIFALFFLVQIAGAGFLLDTRCVVGTLVTVTSVAIALLLRTEPYTAIFISTIVVAASFAIAFHVLMLGALVRAESHRITAAAANRKLELQLAQLAQSQLERTSLQEQLLHAQRMEAVGTLAAGVAHDMNNVLASITSFATLLCDEVGESADLKQIMDQAERGASLTRGLLAFSRRGQYRKGVVQMGLVVRDVLPLLARTLPKSIEIRSELQLGDVCVDADPIHIHQALVNFGLNAAEAMDGKGTLVIAADVVDLDARSNIDLPPGSYVRISVTDTGKGMDAATRMRAFEPFFTTKPLGEGTGLGLSTVWGIAQAHAGAVDVESELGKGSTFRMHLPITTRIPTLHVAPTVTQAILRKSTVLVVDDEPAVRESTKRLLEKMGLKVITANNGQEGVIAFTERSDSIELVMLDMAMPVMGGAECFRQIRERSSVPVLIATGYAVDAEAQAMVAAGATILEKPFPSADLRREVARLLHH